MAYDIYGNHLQRGHCEVHPHVQEEYPCYVCREQDVERRYWQEEQQRLEAEQAREYYEAMNERLTAERDAALAEGVVLREALGLVDSDLLEWHTRYALVGLQPMFELIGRCRQHIDYARGEVPLVSAHMAELERLTAERDAMERVVEAARAARRPCQWTFVAKGKDRCEPDESCPAEEYRLCAALAAYDAARGGGGTDSAPSCEVQKPEPGGTR